MKRRGPMTLPCGTSNVTSRKEEDTLTIQQLHAVFDHKDNQQTILKFIGD
jgi:hypothetical protein